MLGPKLVIFSLVLVVGFFLIATRHKGYSAVTISLTEKALASDLPIKEFFNEGKGNRYVILFTGDGGWKPLVTRMASYFNAKNIPVVGLDTKKYFWEKKTPLETSKDLSELIRHYNAKWHKSEVILIGYSMGADVLPFAVNLLPAEAVNKITNLVLVAPYQFAQFEIKLVNYISAPQDGALVLPEIKKLKVPSVFTICDDDDHALCLAMDDRWDHVIMEGGHHFDDQYDQLNQLIGRKLGLVI